MSRIVRSRMFAWFVMAGCLLSRQTAEAQHTIVLRDLTLLDPVQVVSIDIDGLMLPNDRRFSWSEILQGDVGEFQHEFDSSIATIGMPLYRIRTRMANRSFGELQPMARDLLSLVGESRGRTAYITLAACFHHQLHLGNREAAVRPLLRMLSIREEAGNLEELDSSLGLKFSDSGICLNLLPVWFDKDAAKEVLQFLSDEPETGVAKVYWHSLQKCRPSDTDKVIRNVEADSPWHAVLSAQSAWFNGNPQHVIDSLENSDLNLSPPQRAIALYYVGLAMRALLNEDAGQRQDSAESVDLWKLKLLQIPAQFQNQFPELSAAAIYEVVKTSPVSSTEYDSLRDELIGKLAMTYFGRRYQSNRN